MNVFSSSLDPRESAMALDDVRARKMIMESCQLMASAVRWHTYDSKEVCEGLYQSYAPGNRFCVWSRSSKWNYIWLIQHTSELLGWYQRVSGKTHACSRQFYLLANRLVWLPDSPATPLVNGARDIARGLDFTHIEDTQVAYQEYLKAKWNLDKREPKWTGRDRPGWA